MSKTALRVRASEAIADAKLHDALDAATGRFGFGRLAGPATIANHAELRDAARAIKADVMARLPDVLGQLADGVEARGGHVCWASTAEEANDYVVRLARRHGARLAVKSKSMASEEIHLNAALEHEGVEVVETDLGEWICQLAGEPPAHIVGPAIHKTKADVAELFSAVAGRPLSDVPEELCAFARETLRQKFLDAEIGISGVNFGVADTGSIVIVTNEGNGRMVTSLPKVHVAIMGMERVVSSWDQLDVLLALLTRSAAAQEITTYVNCISGPRRTGEDDGPDEFHLVILDNGRSDVLGTEFQEILHCIRCGACLNACPVYRQIGGHAYGWVYSGPIGAVLTPLLNHDEAVADLPYASSLCGACWEACPVKIPLHDLLLAHRRRKASDASPVERAAWRAWAQAWSRPRVYRATTRAGAAGLKRLPDVFAKRWTDGRSLPEAHGGFRRRFERGEL